MAQPLAVTPAVILRAEELIPAQPDPWNNEYTVSISTRYTEHGTLRTGTYRRRLRTPLVINSLSLETGPGILSGSDAAPFARITDGTVTASASTMIRIQATLDIGDGHIELTLLDMKEGGKAGTPVRVTDNAVYVVNGWENATVSSLNIPVDDFAGLKDFIRSGYAGRLVDVLDVRVA
jgi:hypothetical protein